MAEGHGKIDTEMTVCRIKGGEAKLGSDGTGMSDSKDLHCGEQGRTGNQGEGWWVWMITVGFG